MRPPAPFAPDRPPDELPSTPTRLPGPRRRAAAALVRLARLLDPGTPAWPARPAVPGRRADPAKAVVRHLSDEPRRRDAARPPDRFPPIRVCVPDPALLDPAPTPWTRIDAGPTPRTITVRWVSTSDGWRALARVEVDLDATPPVVTLLEGSPPERRGQPIPEIASFKTTIVDVERPVDVAAIVDGARRT